MDYMLSQISPVYIMHIFCLDKLKIRCSRGVAAFIKPQPSLPCLQEFDTGPYSGSDIRAESFLREHSSRMSDNEIPHLLRHRNIVMMVPRAMHWAISRVRWMRSTPASESLRNGCTSGSQNIVFHTFYETWRFIAKFTSPKGLTFCFGVGRLPGKK
jgi:hypothetical protein